MLYLYDDAIIEDLRESFNITPDGDNAVSIVSPEELIGIASQINDDKIHFPIISLERDPNYQIDTQRKNFTKELQQHLIELIISIITKKQFQ